MDYLKIKEEIVTLIEWPEKIDNKLLITKLIYSLNMDEDMNKRYLTIKGISNKKLNELQTKSN